MSALENFGIYPDAIEKIEVVCESILKDVNEFSKMLGYDDCLDFDIDDDVYDSIVGNGFSDRGNITNSIISEYLYITKMALENAQLCKDFGITFDSYTNCNDSHLYFEHGGITEEYHETGDINGALNEILAEHLCDIICKRAGDAGDHSFDDDENRDMLQMALVQGLKDDEYNLADVVSCYNEWNIAGTLKDMEEMLKVHINSEHKPAVECDKGV